MSLIRLQTLGFLGILIVVQSSVAQSSGGTDPAWINPANGFVFDKSGLSICPVAGFIGSATVGAPVVTGVNWASIAPNQKTAIASRNGSMVRIPDLSNPTQMQSLNDVPALKQAFWATDSSTLVALTGTGQILWLSASGAQVTTQAKWDLDLAAARNAHGQGQREVGERNQTADFQWTLLAADSAADSVLLTAPSGTGWQLRIASRTASPQALPFTGHPAAAVFASKTATAFIADSQSHQITRVDNLTGTPAFSTLAASAQYINEPAGIVLSDDDSRLFAADRDSLTIGVFDSAQGTLITDLPVDSLPASMTVFGTGLFVVNPKNSGLRSFLFLNTALPGNVLFVPRSE